MIYTCSYKNFNTSILKGVSISGDKGKSIKFDGDAYLLLAPKKDFWDRWHQNKGKISEEENNKHYIEEYYKEVLKDLDPLEIYRELDYKTLLCYEDSNEFCHRYIVAAWFELFLGFEVKEVSVKGLNIEEINVDLYEFIKKTLYETIKQNIDTKGFSSLKALYFFNKSELLLEKAKQLEEKCDKRADDVWEDAVSLYMEAHRIEKEHVQKKLKKVLK